jgi:hypothetical protein
VEALGQRLQKGQSLLREIPEDVDTRPQLNADKPEGESLDQPGR